VYFQSRSNPGFPFCQADKGVPLGKTGKIREYLPHSLIGCLDFDFIEKFFHLFPCVIAYHAISSALAIDF
jgi:hypothetical protein